MRNRRSLRLVLQDIDIITPSTESTSMLSDAALIGQKKTRAMAAWAERRGFVTAIHERLFDGSFRRQPDEPAVALCGLDNSLGRQALDQVGFDFVVEAGLGRGHRDFRASAPAHAAGVAARPPRFGARTARASPSRTVPPIRAHAERRRARPLRRHAAGGQGRRRALRRRRRRHARIGRDPSRFLHGGAVHELIDLDLKFPEYRSAVLTQQDFGALNPGYVLAGA